MGDGMASRSPFFELEAHRHGRELAAAARRVPQHLEVVAARRLLDRALDVPRVAAATMEIDPEPIATPFEHDLLLEPVELESLEVDLDHLARDELRHRAVVRIVPRTVLARVTRTAGCRADVALSGLDLRA